jgi:hypothetical protein
MIYLERKPSKALQKYIKCIWTMEYNGTLPSSENERILPDGYTEIIVNFSDKFKCTIDGEKEKFLTNSFVSGPFTKYLHFSGMNPNSFFNDSNELTRYFATDIRMSDLYNTSIEII